MTKLLWTAVLALSLPTPSHTQSTGKDSILNLGDGNAVETGRNSQVTITQNNDGLHPDDVITLLKSGYDAMRASELRQFQDRQVNSEAAMKNAEVAIAATNWASDVSANIPQMVEQFFSETDRLSKRIVELEAGPGKAALQLGLKAIAAKDLDSADLAFADAIESGASTIETVAEGWYQRGRVSELQFKLLDAAERFETAAKIAPSFKRFSKAVEFQILIGAYDKAETLSVDFIDFCEREFGEQHSNTATAYQTAAEVHKENGDYDAAERAIVRAIEIDHGQVGKIPDQAGARQSLYGEILIKSTRLIEAQDTILDALEFTRERFGPNSLEFADRQADLSLSYTALGKLEPALEAQRISVEITEALLGEKAPEFAVRLGRLSQILVELDYLDAGEEAARRALRLTEETLGTRHPRYADRLSELADILFVTQGLSESAKLSERALELLGETLGKTHPTYAKRLREVGVNLALQGDVDRGLKMTEAAVALTYAIFGGESLQYSNAVSASAIAYIQAGKNTKVESLMRTALASAVAAVGDRHPAYGQHLQAAGVMMMEIGKAREATEMLKRGADILLSEFGPDSGQYSIALAYLGLAQIQIGDPAEGEKLLLSAKNIQDSITSRASARGALILQILGKAFFEQARYQEAEKPIRESIEMFEQTGMAQTPIYFSSLATLGNILTLTDRNAEAIKYLESAISTSMSQFKENNIAVIGPKFNLATAYLKDDRYQQAADMLDEIILALEGRDSNSPLIHIAYQNRGTALWELGEQREALKDFAKAVEVTRESFGKRNRAHISAISNHANYMIKGGEKLAGLELAKKAAELAEEFLSPGSPEHVLAIISLKNSLEELDRYQEAIEQQEKLVKLVESSQHIDTTMLIRQLNNLAILQESIGALDQAIDTMTKVVNFDRTRPEDTGESVSLHLANLAYLHTYRGNWDEAEKLHSQAIEFETKYGEDRKEKLLDRLRGLSMLYESSGRENEAIPLFHEMINIAKSAEERPGMLYAKTLADFGSFYRRRNLLEEASGQIDKAVLVAEMSVGETHPEYVNLRLRQIDFLIAATKLEEAEDVVDLVSKFDLDGYPNDHFRSVRTRLKRAQIARARGKLNEAEKIQRDAIDILLKSGAVVTDEKTFLARILRESKRLNEAEVLLESIISDELPFSQDDLRPYLWANIVFARLNLDQGRSTKALKRAMHVKQVAAERLPNDRIYSHYALIEIGRANAALGNFDLAREAFEKSLSESTAQDGDSSPNVLAAKAAMAEFLVTQNSESGEGLLAEVIELASQRFGEKHPFTTKVIEVHAGCCMQ